MVRNLAAFGVPPLDVKITLIETPPLRTIASRPFGVKGAFLWTSIRFSQRI
jgi:hypothetical protein